MIFFFFGGTAEFWLILLAVLLLVIALLIITGILYRIAFFDKIGALICKLSIVPSIVLLIMQIVNYIQWLGMLDVSGSYLAYLFIMFLIINIPAILSIVYQLCKGAINMLKDTS